MPFLCSQPLSNYLLICLQIILCAKHRSIAWWHTWIHDLLLSKWYNGSNVLLFPAQVVAKPCREQTFLLDPISQAALPTPALHSLALNLQVVTQRLCCTSTSEMNECKHLKSSSKNFTLLSLVSFQHHSLAVLWMWALGWPGFCGVSPFQKLQRDISRDLALWPLLEFIFTLLVGCWFFWTPTGFSWCCKYFPAFIHHLSLFARSCSILVDELRAELSSASTYVLEVVWETAPNLFCLSWPFQQSLRRLFPEMRSSFHIPGRRNLIKAWLAALGTKMAFSHPPDITSDTDGLHPRLLHEITAGRGGSLSCLHYTQHISCLLVRTSPFHLSSSVLCKSFWHLTLRMHPLQYFFRLIIKQDKW